MLKWELGRQGTGYKKLKLFQGKYWDCYLIKYPIGGYIPTHTDPVSGFNHYRLNIVICGSDSYVGETLYSSKRIKFFRPDIMPHSVNEVHSVRIVLSIGWII